MDDVRPRQARALVRCGEDPPVPGPLIRHIRPRAADHPPGRREFAFLTSAPCSARQRRTVRQRAVPPKAISPGLLRGRRDLVRHGLPALAACDRATGEPARRYERSRPGELVHIDVKKLGRIPDGGGHNVLGRAAGRVNQDRRNGTGDAYRSWGSVPRSVRARLLPHVSPGCADKVSRKTISPS